MDRNCPVMELFVYDPGNYRPESDQFQVRAKLAVKIGPKTSDIRFDLPFGLCMVANNRNVIFASYRQVLR
jgi:hypothetical protein